MSQTSVIPPKAQFDFKRELHEWTGAIVSAVVCVVVIFAFFFSIFTVTGPSMENTLFTSEKLLISRLFYTPKRGDIVIFSKAGIEVVDETSGRQIPLVKRVIGLPGETITVDYVNSVLTINGTVFDEPYIKESMRPYLNSTEDTFVVSPGCILVMGDNRNNSVDSRAPAIGEVNQGFILGHVILRISPLDKFGKP
jgi:signal peptidase I